MLLKVMPLRLEAKKPIVILNKVDAWDLGVKPLDRVELRAGRKKEIAIVNIAERFVKTGSIGLYSRVQDDLNVKAGRLLDVTPSEPPESLGFIRKRLAGNRLRPGEISQIVRDVVDEKLSEIEVTSFVISLYNHKMTMSEAAALSKAMTLTGETLDLGKKEIYDKHSIGGIPGDGTSILLVPIVSAAGLTIPKTSSRAITAPAGSADRMECLCPVELGLEEIKRVVKKTNGCLVWGGAVDLAPADDAFIRIEYPLSIDPMLLPSVLSKKKAVGARYVVIDIPTGRGVKVKTADEAEELANQFIELGKKLEMVVSCASTLGEQPIGYAVGPALEAREALQSINGRGPQDLTDKAVHLSSILFDFKGIKNSKGKALDILKSGKAEKKLREIIRAQGGDPGIKVDDIPVGPKRVRIKSNTSGKVLWINNSTVIEVARTAGAPKDKGAGILFHRKMGDTVKKGDVLFEIYAEKAYKMNRALKIAKENEFIEVGRRYRMLLEKIPARKKHEEFFVLER